LLLCGAPRFGGQFSKIIPWFFEIQKQFLPAQTEVQFAEGKHKFEKFLGPVDLNAY